MCKTLLDLDMEQAFDCLTEGAGFWRGCLAQSEEVDGEFVVTLFQSKYRQSSTRPGILKKRH